MQVTVAEVSERHGTCPRRDVLDDFGGGYLMGEYLARQGHRRIAHVTGPDFFSEAMARADGFEKALSDNGVAIDPALRFTGSYLAPSGREAAAWLRHGHALPTAVFFANYLMASGALTEFYDSGISVPGQIAVSVFDDLSQLEYVRPRLTRVGNSPATLARQATTMLLERLNGSFTGAPRTATVPSILHPFDSA